MQSGTFPWVRYLPGLVAVIAGTGLILLAPPRRRVLFAILATLVGLTSMEAEYWVAHGFPVSEIGFFTVTVLITLLSIPFGAKGGFALGVAGLVFFAYVNIRYYAPYLLDYILPVQYALLLVFARREMNWRGLSFWACGRLEIVWLVLTNAIAIWRTFQFDKWGWVLGRPW